MNKFVRVTLRREDGFVEFDFAIGSPDIFVELMLPEAAFRGFCEQNQVILLEGERQDAPGDDWAWRMSDARHQRFR
ncbi:MAG: phenol hydroxylase [Betaproteobacteria bacterium HGW-Betaproteobacteria-11]|nr:MAG: phenol hydroxylase [Betaproteobacteria bacterium HGW-Betaproteobacteria-11]